VNNRRESNRQLLRYGGLALQMLLSIALGIYLGIKTDEWLQFSFPLLVWLFPLLIIAAIIIKIIKETGKK